MKTTKNMTQALYELAKEELRFEDEDTIREIINEGMPLFVAIVDYDKDTEEWTYDEKQLAMILRTLRGVYRRGARDVYSAMQQAASSML